jgi:hypothetical protein
LSDSPEVQKVLPQIFVSNEHVLSKKDVEELNASTARNVLFIRRKSSWVNSVLLIELLGCLARYLGGYMSSHRVVLCMDTFRAHLQVDVVKKCSQLGFLLFYVRASMTAWLQPLDIAVFKAYKDWVASELERQRGRLAAGGSLSQVATFLVYAEGIRTVLEGKSWTRAFELAGLRGQDRASAELLGRLGCALPVSAEAELPSAEDLAAVYPRRANVPVDELFDLPLRLSTSQPKVLVLPKRARLTTKSAGKPPLPQPA